MLFLYSLFWIIALILFPVGIGLFYEGLWGDRSKGRLRCPKCRHDMLETFEMGSSKCPECGKDAGSEKKLKKNHRRWWAIVLAVVLLLPHFSISFILFLAWWQEGAAVANEIPSLWLLPSIVAMLFPASIGLFYFGYWGDLSKGRFRCPKCWYDMSGSFVAGRLVCPECGKDAKKEKQLRKNRLRYWAIIPSGLSLLLYLVAAGYGTYIWSRWQREQPTVAAIEKSYVGVFVLEESIAPHSVLAWIPIHLRGYFDRVKTVAWQNSLISDRALAQVEDLEYLKHLTLANTAVTDAGMSSLHGLIQLQHLDLQGTNVTDAGLAHLRGLTQLKELLLKGTEVTDAGLVHLKTLPSLQHLELWNTQVTNAGLVHLGEMTQLKHLGLGKTKVTDAGLVHLKNLTSLRYLELSNTKVTNFGLAYIQKALPNCEVEGRSYSN